MGDGGAVAFAAGFLAVAWGAGGVFSIRSKFSSSFESSFLAMDDMPQPIRKRCSISLTGFNQRPQHALVIGQIMGISGRLEAIPGWIIAFCFGPSAMAADAMFNLAVTVNLKKDMLSAVAKVALSDSEFSRLEEILSDFPTRIRERNTVTHSIWGYSVDHPDKAILCPPAAARQLMARTAKSGSAGSLPDPSDLSLECQTWTVRDLENVRDRLAEYTEKMGQFWLSLVISHPAIAATTLPPNLPP